MSAADLPPDAPRPRQCTLRKWPDFNGYGFNLHAEKGKAGQFIGKVDDESPAFYAGLRSGDRIVEVSKTNIGNETHSQVVQRVKACGEEVSLFVVDQDTDDYYQKRDLVVNSSWDNVEYHETPSPRPGQNQNVDNIVAGVVAIDVNSEPPVVEAEPVHVEETVVTTVTTVVESPPPPPPVDSDDDEVIVENNETVVTTTTITEVIESEPEPPVELLVVEEEPLVVEEEPPIADCDIQPPPDDIHEVDGAEVMNGEVITETVTVVEESAPPPPPEPEVEPVHTQVVETTVVQTTVVTKVDDHDLNQMNDRTPTPEPVIIQKTETTVVESKPDTNGDASMLSMSAKEYREYIKNKGKARGQRGAGNFHEKTKVFNHL